MTRVVLGTMRTSGNFNSLMVVDRDTHRAAEVVRMARKLNLDGLDTAPIYARTLAESDLGELCHDLPVWTKVGVDVRTPLPTLDYSLPTMAATLAESGRRLRRSSVDCVLVHNPPIEAFRTFDWPEMHRLLVQEGPARDLGVSVLDPSEIALVADVGTPLVTMVETAVLERHPELALRLRDAGHRLVLRSLFAGGRSIRTLPAERRAQAVTERLTALTAAFDPWALVIAPRTPEQFADYLPAVEHLRAETSR
ncbi:aldo/keto reductase [Streptomyces fimicarius]|uniref:aldo/keto reductase n=1 Tax=Streptomyces griseus TaxID=1911 RepID=UPI0036C21AA1